MHRVASFVVLSLVACREPTQITLALTTDATCDDLEETRVTVGAFDAIEANDPTTVTSLCSGGEIGSLVAIPIGDDHGDIAFKIISSVDAKPTDTCDTVGELASHCIVARRALSFIPNTPLLVPVVMRESCAGAVYDGSGFDNITAIATGAGSVAFAGTSQGVEIDGGTVAPSDDAMVFVTKLVDSPGLSSP